jgi:hypothetical protein
LAKRACEAQINPMYEVSVQFNSKWLGARAVEKARSLEMFKRFEEEVLTDLRTIRTILVLE